MDLKTIIETTGYVGIFGIIFSESGLLFGIVFPGDSVLFTAGFLASQGVFHIGWLILVCFVAAVSGDSVGYTFGRRVGKRFFVYERSIFFNPDNVTRAQEFYKRHGGKAIILARFLPGIRTLAPILAGVGEMDYRMFVAYNVLGGVLWAIGLTALGYLLGSVIPNADRYIVVLVLGIVVLSTLPTLVPMFRTRTRRQKVLDFLKRLWRRK
jgi:membrane-associated protein